MKTIIVALYPYNGQDMDSWHDHGVGMTYTAAKAAGHDIDSLDTKSLSCDDELRKRLVGYDLVAFGLRSAFYSLGMKIVEMAKAQHSKVIVGGYHVTAAPKELLENPNIDWIFHGESELTFPLFLKSPADFPREIFGEKPPNLDTLPFIDRSIYREPLEDCSDWWYGKKFKTMTSVITARGCPYQCAFCQPLEDNHFGKRLRRRSVDNIISELRQLKKLYRPDCLMIHDDTFLLQPTWIEEFIEKYPEIGLPFWAAARADGVCKYPDLVNRLAKVGWNLVSVGFESGSQRILDLMKKGSTVEQNFEAARIIKSSGARIYGNYIVGIPGETREEIQATVQMADMIGAEMPCWSFLTPYPGNELADEYISKGWSLLDRNTYNRCPYGPKLKNVDYDYLRAALGGLREFYPTSPCDIIIPTYENEKFTIDCLESIKKYTKPGTYRVIWVDNGSKSTTEVEKAISGMNHLFIKLPKNEGYVGATNAGLKASTAPTVCLLNNDTQVTDRWLEKLTTALYSAKDIGIVGPLTGPPSTNQHFDSHHNIAYIQQLKDTPNFPAWTDIVNFNLQMEGQPLRKVRFVGFFCALIKREVINKVGILDPNYAMGLWDDVDYSYRVQKAGYKTLLSLNTCIQHHGRATFSLIEQKEHFNVNVLLRKNLAYLEKTWGKIPLISTDTFIISRAIYNTLGSKPGLGVLDENRLGLMQKYFINSLKNQIDQIFTLYIVTGASDNETTKQIEALDWGDLNVKFIHTSGDTSLWKSSIGDHKSYGRENDEGCPEIIARTCEHPQASVMARMDTDDWVAPGWVAHMKYMANTIEETYFLINYQVIGQALDGRLYHLQIPHSPDRTSPFIALVQKEPPRISPYEDTHLKMGKRFSSVYTIPPSYVYMVVHGGNRSNRLHPLDNFIGFSNDRTLSLYEDNKKPERLKRPPMTRKIPRTIKGTDWKSRITDHLIFEQTNGRTTSTNLSAV